MIVIDASVALKWVVEEDFSDLALDLLPGPDALIAPAFWLIETANALWKRVLEGNLTVITATLLQSSLLTAPLHTQEDAPLIPPALELAAELAHPVYDCLYLALAIRERATLVTADRKFATIARRGGYGAHLRVLGDTPAQP